MDPSRFDALTRRLAGARTRRQLVQALGGGAIAALGSLATLGRADAGRCPSGKSCSAQCCPNADDICLAGICTSCPSGITCSAQCCDEGETCHFGQCQRVAPEPTSTPPPGPCGGVGDPCAAGGDCCAPNVCADGACTAACPSGYRLCDGVCYPGGCCAVADCGLACQVCGADHACHPCDAAGQVCQNGACVAPYAAVRPGHLSRRLL